MHDLGCRLSESVLCRMQVDVLVLESSPAWSERVLIHPQKICKNSAKMIILRRNPWSPLVRIRYYSTIHESIRPSIQSRPIQRHSSLLRRVRHNPTAPTKSRTIAWAKDGFEMETFLIVHAQKATLSRIQFTGFGAVKSESLAKTCLK